MRNMKTLLRILGAVSLTTIAANSVVACGKWEEQTEILDSILAKDLGLIDANGGGLITPIINFDILDNFKANWRINLKNITAENLVTPSKNAKDKKSFDFLKNILKIKIDSGATPEDAVFNQPELYQTTMTVSDINISINKLSNKNDYYISYGQYNITFENSKTKTCKYTTIVKANADADKKGIFEKNKLLFNITKENFNNTFQSEFKVNQAVNKFKSGTILTSMLVSRESKMKIMAIEKLLNVDLQLVVTKNDIGGNYFSTNDKIEIGFSTKDINFSFLPSIELTVNP